MKISTLVLVGFVLVLALFTLTTYVNYKQFQLVSENAEWVAVSQTVVRNSTRLQRNMIEMESNLRGYLLTGEEIFLTPFDSATSENIVIVDELKTLLEHNPRHEKKLGRIAQLHDRWRSEYADPLITAKRNASLSDSAEAQFVTLYNDKSAKRVERLISSSIRDEFKELNNNEYDLREERKANLEASVFQTKIVSFVLTSTSIILGLAIALYITYTISKRINYMVMLADRIAKGNFNIPIKDQAKDELGNLSRSLNSMAKILEENISSLERKNTELDRFAYVVSHDLKAPLRGIENASSWIEEDFGSELPHKVKEYLFLIRGRIHRMENLINGILDLARIGKEKSSLEVVDLQLMLLEIIEMLGVNTDLDIIIQKNMPVFTTEKIPLQQIFSNLISNAVKYHHKNNGKIMIGYKDKNTHYEFFVADDGPGIATQYQEKIFIIFQTLKERDAFESTGVGLAIVKKILDDKKCFIKVDSDIGKGARFTFSWPKEMAMAELVI